VTSKVITAPGDARGVASDHRLLEVEDLRTWFRTDRGTVKAVDGVSLTLDRGMTLGVVGESGSGKTILSRSVMGLLPARNTIRTGRVRYEGVDIVDYDQHQMRDIWGAEMAMVFQDPMTSLNPVMKIGHQITESLVHHLRMGKSDAKQTAIALLASVGIPEPAQRFDEYPHQLSGGMRQRVTIAIALACGPKLLFADEPTTALDVTVQAQILDLLAAQQRERHMAMILVTHDLGVVAGRTDEILVMYGGKVVEHAPTTALFDQVKMPYTEALLRSIPKLDMASHTRLDAIPGRPPDLVNQPAGCNFAPRCRYVQPRCLREEPPLLTIGTTGHRYRCWFPVGTAEGSEALARNTALAAGSDDIAAAGLKAATDALGTAPRRPDGPPAAPAPPVSPSAADLTSADDGVTPTAATDTGTPDTAVTAEES
jgi:oligopeptide/dipeptide ABC transporter ATP-binding protein